MCTVKDPLSRVNIFQGTNSCFDYSTGNTSPLMVRPWGMTAWSLQTREGGWFYHDDDRKCHGIRATHQPSPWIGDYGHFTLLPFTGPALPEVNARSSAYRWDKSQVGPGGGRLTLLRYGIDVDLAVSSRGAAMQLVYRDEGAQPGFLVSLFEGEGELEISPDRRAIRGWTRANNGGVPDGFACYFLLEFDRPFSGFGAGHDAALKQGIHRFHGKNGQAYVTFDRSEGGVVNVRAATSFIHADQAAWNMQRELGGLSCSALRQQADDEWQALLSRVEIETDDRTAALFYSALYRASLFPRTFHEIDHDGSPIHYSPFDGGIHPGVMYTDSGFWDAHRTVYPWLSVFAPDRLGEIVDGWLNAYRQGGWLPKWASPGYRESMVGSHSDVVVAEAIVKEIPGFDRETAYQAILKNATTPGEPRGFYGRLGLHQYEQLGYVPVDQVEHAVSRTLDFAFGDYAISQAAHAMDDQAQAMRLRKRSRNYRHVFDHESGFMCGRQTDGSWVTPFDPCEWGGPYCEGGAWQYLWAVPHDVEGLMELLGGPKRMTQRLEAMLHMPPRFSLGSYAYEIHEMTEMAMANFGTYAHSNQPVHHALYLFAHAGAPERTRYWVQRVLDELYTPDELPGDEDNGEMSAWYLFSALGLYPVNPAQGAYTLGSPRVSRAVIHHANARPLTIVGDENPFALIDQCHVDLDGQAHAHPIVSHRTIKNGATIRFSTTPLTSTKPTLAASQSHS